MEKQEAIGKCPICGGERVSFDVSGKGFFPFCSARCKMVDLGRWLGEEYCIPEELPQQVVDED